MLHRIVWIFIFALGAATSAALAAGGSKEDDPSKLVFLVGLDMPIEHYPLCDSPEGAAKICRYAPLPSEVSRSEQSSSQKETLHYIELRPQRPAFLKTNIMAMVVDGKIVSLSAQTNGVMAHQQAWDHLTMLLGKHPADLTETPMQNAFGARVLRVEAMWKTPSAVVLYKSVSSRLDEGIIMIVPKR